MEFKLIPYHKNSYPVVGVLFKGKTPREWLNQIEALDIDLSEVKSYAIPSHKANVLYGCLVMTQVDKETINQQQLIVGVSKQLFIPQYADVSPKLTAEEWQTTFQKPCVFLPEIGLFELEQEIDWFTVFKINRPKAFDSHDILENYFVPKQIKSIQMAVSEEDLLKEIENSTVEAADLKDVPFDMKKVMAGNTKEVEKYLRYIEMHPEFALKYPFPLDVFGTSRNGSDGVFDFQKFIGLFGGLFGGFRAGKNGGSKDGSFGDELGRKIINSPTRNQNFNILIWMVVPILVGLIAFVYNDVQKKPTQNFGNSSSSFSISPVLVFFLFIGVLLFLMFSNKLTFGRGTLSRKIAVNGSLIFALFFLLNPILNYYSTPVLFKLVLVIGVLFLIHKVYNINAQFFKPE